MTLSCVRPSGWQWNNPGDMNKLVDVKQLETEDSDKTKQSTTNTRSPLTWFIGYIALSLKRKWDYRRVPWTNHNYSLRWPHMTAIASRVTRLFVRQFVHANDKENNKALFHSSFAMIIHRWPVDSTGPVMQKAFSCYGIIMFCSCFRNPFWSSRADMVILFTRKYVPIHSVVNCKKDEFMWRPHTSSIGFILFDGKFTEVGIRLRHNCSKRLTKIKLDLDKKHNKTFQSKLSY